MTVRRIVLCGAAIGFALPALSQGPPPDSGRHAELIRKYDKNGDGKLSESEVQAARSAASPTRQRPAVARPGGPAESAKEARSATSLKHDKEMQALLDRFDVNGNGTLELPEMDTLRKERKRGVPRAVPRQDVRDAATPSGKDGTS